MILADGTTALLVAGNNFSPPDLAEVGRVILVIGGAGGSLVNRGGNGDFGDDDDVCDGNDNVVHLNIDIISQVYYPTNDSWAWTSYMQV